MWDLVGITNVSSQTRKILINYNFTLSRSNTIRHLFPLPIIVLTIHHGMIYINRSVYARFLHLTYQCLSSIHIACLTDKYKSNNKNHQNIILRKPCKSECVLSKLLMSTCSNNTYSP
ncbi:hypothetical protein CIPAW_13G041700 [Carya illinoinensis]|uniref:Uncharacterized protein n=1 Tax=Carya illinoinensis TaxID=32201 RepID=A0A8T1NPA3_CARIL|nr:hypothetical protein CIPAW_13G041700 [Carya illinoinensis]